MTTSRMDYEGIISDADADSYFSVIQEAFRVHLDREKIRKGLWKEYPAKSQVDVIRTKVDRVLRSLERIAEDPLGDLTDIEALKRNILEELYDIINYSVFAARILRGQL